MKREYAKSKQSQKWSAMNEAFLEKCSEEKQKCYDNVVSDLKESNPVRWY